MLPQGQGASGASLLSLWARKVKGIPKKVELVQAVTDLFRGDWEGLMQRVGGSGLVVKNNTVEKERFLV